MDENKNNLENEELDEVVVEDNTEEEVLEETVAIDCSLPIEEVEDLNSEEALVLASKLEVEIQKYEDILLEGEKKYLSDEELIELGYNDEEYHRLKDLEKAVYKHIKSMRKASEKTNIFTYLPVWLALLGIVVLLFNFYPVNPMLLVEVIIQQANKHTDWFTDNLALAYIFYAVYLAIFYIPLLVMFIITLIKAIKHREVRKTFYWFIGILIVDIGVGIPGIVSFFRMMSRV